MEQNKRLVQKVIEAFNAQDLTVFLELYTEDAVIHGVRQEYEGRDGLEQFAMNQVARFPDVEVTGEDLFATADRAAARFTLAGTHEGPFLGVEPTGQEVEFPGIALFRFEDDKIAEQWLVADQLGAMYQLGVIESPDGYERY